MVTQGRVNELDARSRGTLRKLEEHFVMSRKDDIVSRERAAIIAEHEAAKKQEQDLRDLYLSLDATRLNDPETWAEFTASLDPEDQQKYEFFKWHRQRRPEISAEDPDGNGFAPSPEYIRAKVGEEYHSALTEFATGIAREAGVPDEEIKSFTGPNVSIGKLMATAVQVTAQAKANEILRVERHLIAQAERKAAEQEAAARYVGREVIVPRLAGVGRDPRGVVSSGNSMWDALQEAKVLAEASSR